MLVAIIDSQHLSGHRRVAAQIILACAAGEKGVDIAARMGVTARTVSRWRIRFVDSRQRTLGVG
ncbi:helix-turn-helix domain-containing protein [Pseudomonas sp. PLB05]|nr:helix-turn-helix domain-containing protein [Pseudomonas sp. PLB05]MCD4865224.1 helix-turn-helix domain-containing protein [Pseudomonas sp. PLB05]